jgi:hypothetical protein
VHTRVRVSPPFPSLSARSTLRVSCHLPAPPSLFSGGSADWWRREGGGRSVYSRSRYSSSCVQALSRFGVMPVEARWPWLVGGSWRPEEVLPQLVKLHRKELLASSGAALPSTRVNKAQGCTLFLICAASPSSPAGHGGEGRGHGGAVSVGKAWWQQGEVKLLQRKLPSVGELRRRYLWPRRPLRASGASFWSSPASGMACRRYLWRSEPLQAGYFVGYLSSA